MEDISTLDRLAVGRRAAVTSLSAPEPLACAFYQLAGFACREASLRWFLFFGDLAVPFSLAALADSSGNWGKTLAWKAPRRQNAHHRRRDGQRAHPAASQTGGAQQKAPSRQQQDARRQHGEDFKGLRLWVEGLLLLALRWAQLKSGFDPETGLSLRSVPGLVLAAGQHRVALLRQIDQQQEQY